jgi:hypothetical protein
MKIRLLGVLMVAAGLLAGCATVYSNGKTGADYGADDKACGARLRAQVEAGTLARTPPAVLDAYDHCMAEAGWPGGTHIVPKLHTTDQK